MIILMEEEVAIKAGDWVRIIDKTHVSYGEKHRVISLVPFGGCVTYALKEDLPRVLWLRIGIELITEEEHYGFL